MNHLILLDPAKIRRHWQTLRRTNLRDIETIRARLAEFERTGYDLYQSWLHRTFPNVLNQLRAIEEESGSIERLLHAVAFEAKWMKLKKHEAYALVLERQERSQPLISDDARAAEENAYTAEQEAFRETRDRFRDGTLDEDDLEMMREDLRNELRAQIGRAAQFISDDELDEIIGQGLGVDPDEIRDRKRGDAGEDPRAAREEDEPRAGAHRHGPNAGDSEDEPTPSAGDPAHAKALKTLYRELARRLHPDANGGHITSDDRKLWHEVQAAYERGDVERLSALRAFAARASHAVDAIDDSIAALIAMVRGLKATLKDLRASERKLQKDKIFWFYKNRENARKLKTFADEEKHELWIRENIARARLGELKTSVKRFAKVPVKAQKRRPR